MHKIIGVDITIRCREDNGEEYAIPLTLEDNVDTQIFVDYQHTRPIWIDSPPQPLNCTVYSLRVISIMRPAHAKEVEGTPVGTP
jgi:hypothetical protein